MLARSTPTFGLLILSSVLAGLTSVTPCAGQLSGGGGGTPAGVSPEAGSPFPWEAGIPVSTYSSVNLFNGNLLTRIPISRSPSVGPDLDFFLYHNSGAVIPSIPAPPGIGRADLGPGWSVSFAGRVVHDSQNGVAYVVEDDGLLKRHSFDSQTGEWIADVGIYDTLEQSVGGWTVHRKNQWRREFAEDGRFLYACDALEIGNPAFPPCIMAIWRPGDPPALDLLISGSSSFIKFIYLDDVLHLDTEDETFNLVHNGTQRLLSIEFPSELVTIDITYDPDGRIATISDKENKTYTYTYDSLGRLETVTDPVGTTQVFSYAFVPTNKYRTTYTDRRGKQWEFLFWNWGGLIEAQNPLSQKWSFQYDAARNRTHFTDPLLNTWIAGYDVVANLTSLTDPIGHRWELTYDNFNNLTSITPPLDSFGGLNVPKRVDLFYEDYVDPQTQQYADPTHVTRIVEPAANDDPGDPSATPATTSLAWNQQGELGELRSVIDPVGVESTFAWSFGMSGMSLTRRELPSEAIGVGQYPVEEWFIVDGHGRLTSNGGYNGEATFSYASSGGDCPRSLGSASDISCQPVEGKGKKTSAPPPDDHMPVSSCCLYHPMPTCQIPWPEFSCGQACNDHMENVRQFLWPTYSLLSYLGLGEYEAEVAQRVQFFDRDDLYRLTSYSVDTSIPIPEATAPSPDLWPSFERGFALTPDANGNLDLLVDADGMATDYVYDDANRLTDIYVNGQLIVHYELDPVGRATSADFADGTRTEWVFDEASRITWIKHYGAPDGGGQRASLLLLNYAYSPDGLITSIEQTDTTGSYLVNFDYDRRGRLVREYGVLPPVSASAGPISLDNTYVYDQVGNRLKRTDATTSPPTVTWYFYDVTDANWPTTYGTYNNRLMRYEMRQGTSPTDPLLESCWFAYNGGGQVKRIVRHFPQGFEPAPGQMTPVVRDPDTWYVTCLQYNIDQHLWLVREMECAVGSLCDPEPEVGEPTAVITRAREYRYDGDTRRRYLVRDRDPADLSPISNSWREFLGSLVYADLTVDEQTGVSVAARRYLHAGDGRLLGWNDAGQWYFVKADHLGSTRLVTSTAGLAGAVAYSAFGEVLGEDFPAGPAARSRYGYCGGWGYENDALAEPGDILAGLGLLHVGARYYSPGLGRFVQRDPIGIAGGMNTYTYVTNRPMILVDPTGLAPPRVRCGRLFIMGGAFGLGHFIGFTAAHVALGVDPGTTGSALNVTLSGGLTAVWSGVVDSRTEWQHTLSSQDIKNNPGTSAVLNGLGAAASLVAGYNAGAIDGVLWIILSGQF